MQINNNIQALNAYRNLYQNQQATSSNLEKLSSGLRINRAADDAAGLAISEKMRSQIRGLEQAERNAMDGISLIQTSEGAMEEVHSMLQRMRELTVQAANDTNTEEDTEQIQKEIDQLKDEIDSVSEKTEFNTRSLLDGSSAVSTNVEGELADTPLAEDPSVDDIRVESGDYRLGIDDAEIVSTVTESGAGLEDGSDISFEDESNKPPLGKYEIEVRDFDSEKDTATVEVTNPNGETETVNHRDVTDDINVGGLTIPSGEIEGNGTATVEMEADVSAAVMDEANQELTIENPSVECEVVGEGAGISEGAELTFAQRVEEHVAGEYTVTVGDFNSDEQTATITVEDPNGKTETLPNQDLTSDITAAGLTIPGDAIEGDGDFTVDMSRSVQTNWDTVEDEDEIIADGGNIRLADSTDETSLGEYTIDVEETFFQTWAETITVTDPDGDTHTVTSEDPGEDIEVAGLVIEADTLTNENSGTEGGKVVIDIDGDITEGSSVSGANIADDAVTFGHREEEHQLGEYRINVSNYDSNNNTATIEVERPDGSTEEVTDQELDGEFIIGGLEINENLISGDGSATVRMQPDGETIIGEREMRTENGRFEYNGVEFTFDGSVANDPEDVDFSIENNALAFQIGPNAGQDVLVDIPKMDVEELGLDELDVTSQRSANDGISILDGAITQVSDARATLGAMQNRMEHTVNNLQVTSENLTAAESRIRDTDMAEEMTEFTRNNILNQSGTAMLAQANQLPQGVLELLQ